jgi:hypothetical protein
MGTLCSRDAGSLAVALLRGRVIEMSRVDEVIASADHVTPWRALPPLSEAEAAALAGELADRTGALGNSATAGKSSRPSGASPTSLVSGTGNTAQGPHTGKRG